MLPPISAHQNQLKTDQHWMRQALTLAEKAGSLLEVPVGAILIKDNAVLAKAHNSPIGLHDPTAHAEILAIRQATKQLHNYRLPEPTTLYVTLEPCIMCMGALIHARVTRLVYGASDPKTGAAASVYSIGSDDHLNHEIQIVGDVLADKCGTLLRSFFKERRAQKKQMRKL